MVGGTVKVACAGVPSGARCLAGHPCGTRVADQAPPTVQIFFADVTGLPEEAARTCDADEVEVQAAVPFSSAGRAGLLRGRLARPEELVADQVRFAAVAHAALAFAGRAARTGLRESRRSNAPAHSRSLPRSVRLRRTRPFRPPGPCILPLWDGSRRRRGSRRPWRRPASCSSPRRRRAPRRRTTPRGRLRTRPRTRRARSCGPGIGARIGTRRQCRRGLPRIRRSSRRIRRRRTHGRRSGAHRSLGRPRRRSRACRRRTPHRSLRTRRRRRSELGTRECMRPSGRRTWSPAPHRAKPSFPGRRRAGRRSHPAWGGGGFR